MDDLEKDVNEDAETSPDSSPGELADTSAGEDTVTNEEAVSIKKTDWEAMQEQVSNLNIALQQERKKAQRLGLTPEVERDEEPKKRKKDDVPDFLVSQRRKYEVQLKDKFVKQFPSIAANNTYGIDDEIVENYNDLLEGRIKRGVVPWEREEVAELLEKAIRMSKPELFVKQVKESGDDYTGMDRGVPYEEEIKSEPPMSAEERKFKNYNDQRLKSIVRNTKS